MPDPTPAVRKVSATDRAYILLALRIAGDFGIAIAAPVIVFARAGKWLDIRYNTAPRLLIVGFILAAALSALIVWRKTKDFAKEYEAIGKKGVV